MTRAEARHDDRGVATIAARLAPIAIALDKLDEARALIDLGAAALARIGNDPSVELNLTDARAQLASATGDHATAIALLEKLVEPAKRRGDSMLELYTLLARELVAAGRFAEAQQALAQPTPPRSRASPRPI